MRDYLYIWNDPEKQSIVASGIEFKDIAGYVRTGGGLVLLKHDVCFAEDFIERDPKTNLYYVRHAGIPELTKQDIYSWGDFNWVDYQGASFPALSDQEIAEVLFFSQMGRPLGSIALPGLNNKFLCNSHDDGWFLRLYYSSWEDVAPLIVGWCPQLDLDELRGGRDAYWVSGESVEVAERTFEVDLVISRRY